MTVDNPLTMYRTRVTQLEPCSDEWFADALRETQAGNETARRRISGSCLRVALQVADRVAGQLPDADFLEAVQTANNGLWRSIDTFPGGNADAFVRHVEQAVEEYLNRYGCCSK